MRGAFSPGALRGWRFARKAKGCAETRVTGRRTCIVLGSSHLLCAGQLRVGGQGLLLQVLDDAGFVAGSLVAAKKRAQGAQRQ
jgi:hypothetical protein